MGTMKGTERFYVTMPDSEPTANEFSRIAPNEGHFPIDATVTVLAEDGHVMNFAILPKGPQQKDYLLSLIDSKPPITTTTPYEKEVYVIGDRISKGEKFQLTSAFPIFLSETAFKAIAIYANVAAVVLPMTIEDIAETE